MQQQYRCVFSGGWLALRTQDFLAYFSEDILWAHTPLLDLPLEDGVCLMAIAPVQAGGHVFLGDFSAWKQLCADKRLCPGSSYLICLGAGHTLQPPAETEDAVNTIFLRLSVDEAVRRLDAFCRRDVSRCSGGDEVLVSFFRAISLQNFCSKEAVAAWIERFPFPLETFIACPVLRPQTGLAITDLAVRDVTEALRSFFPETNLFFYKTEWIVFYSQKELASDEIGISYPAFSKPLEKHRLNAGVSYVGVLPENIYTLYLTAAASVELGTQISIPPQMRRIYSFAQYHPLYLIHLGAQEYDRLHQQRSFYYMAHPDIVRIFIYDQEHKTDLLDTLYAYLLNDSSLARAAQYLYVHRNTVYNKLLKIENLLGYKLSRIHDHSVFTISYMVVKYYCDYQSKELK